MSEVDVVVIPRRRLSSTDLVLPLKLLEAGAAKKPVIIAKTKIVEHELLDKKNVLMYEPENPVDLAAKICQIYTDANLRERLGPQLFEYVHNKDWNTIGRNLSDVLQALEIKHNPTKNRNDILINS